MKLLEIQAKKLLKIHSIPVPSNGGSVKKISEISAALKRCGAAPWVIKAQVQTGGRGKAGGIKVARTPAEAKKIAQEILGMKLVTAQTGPTGIIVKEIMVEKPAKISRELYVSVVLDRKSARAVLIASTQGGMDIEQAAQTDPQAILRMPIEGSRLEDFQARDLIFRLGLADADPKKSKERGAFFKNVVKAFFALDAMLLEINPLAVTDKGELLALDAKVTIDDNALFRHPELEEFNPLADFTPAEKEARLAGISYISLSGKVGCMVNGAGLAMATMDILKLHGGEPANFLDVGGSANVDQVSTAFKIILSDKNVKAVFINIFGGIMKCDVIAQGVVEAVKKTKLSVPLVVRLEGNRKTEGEKILKESNLPIESVSGFSQAAQKAVELVRFR